MKQLRLLILAAAATALCTATVYACGNDKTSATAASAGNAKAAACCATGKKASATAAAANGCTAAMAAQCTPEMAAACTQAKKGGKMAANQCPMSGASAGGCTMHGKTSATAASADCCSPKGKASATAASASMAGNGSCSAHGKASMAAGSSCSAHGTGTSMAMHSCDACSDMAQAENELDACGARAQVVPLKNGVMYVYTADSPDRIRAVQAAVARSNERVRATLAAGDRAKLCPGCKQVRGAMASGKMHREVVNVETGAMTLVTSNDKSIVNRLHASAGTEVAERATTH